jgi:2'-5' RNA ligase
MGRGATARLFVAVDPPAPVRDGLSSWARHAVSGAGEPGAARAGRAPLRVLDPDALHLTLIFLGSRPVGEIETIGAALDRCTARIGELSVGAPVWLPPRRPRALAVEIRDPGGELADLQAAVRDAVAGATGWEPERRGFRAHITVLRTAAAARRRRPSVLEVQLPATPQLRFTPSHLVVYRSWLSRAGAAYEAVAARALHAADL